MSDLLNVRVIAEPLVAVGAVHCLVEVLDLDRQDGPYPSRKSPTLVRYYLTGRLQPIPTAAAAAGAGAGDRGEWLCSALVQVRGAIAAVLEDETADRQSALEEADRSLEELTARWRASIGLAAGPTRQEAGR